MNKAKVLEILRAEKSFVTSWLQSNDASGLGVNGIQDLRLFRREIEDVERIISLLLPDTQFEVVKPSVFKEGTETADDYSMEFEGYWVKLANTIEYSSGIEEWLLILPKSEKVAQSNVRLVKDVFRPEMQ